MLKSYLDHVDENNIIQTILNLMEQVEGFIDKNGLFRGSLCFIKLRESQSKCIVHL